MRRLLILTFIVLSAGCSKRDLPQQVKADSVPVLEKHVVPTVVNPNKSFLVSVRIANAEAAEVDSVRLSIGKQGESSTKSYALYDDGAAFSTNDGDVIAGDGIFTQEIIWRTTDQQRFNYIFKFEAANSAGQQGDPLEVAVVSQANISPEIISISMPDSLPSGFSGEERIEVTVADSNGVDDVVRVAYKGVRNNTTFFQGVLKDDGQAGDILAGDGIFTAAIDRSFAINKNGVYEMIFEAQDRSDSKSLQLIKPILIRNGAPLVTAYSAPDSVKRPSGSNIAGNLVTVQTDDPQTSRDVKSVLMEWKKPDGTYPASGPNFTLFDNGLPFDVSRWDLGYRGDAVAGDGIYSITSVFDSDDLLGTYTLTFQIEDWVGNKSNPVTHLIELY